MASACEAEVMYSERPELDGRTSGGELSSAIATAVVRVMSRRIGRGPTRAYAFYSRNVVTVVMHEAMTRTEQTLVAIRKKRAPCGNRPEMGGSLRRNLRVILLMAPGPRMGAGAILDHGHVPGTQL
jgi:uncharacterized protein YbcI